MYYEDLWKLIVYTLMLLTVRIQWGLFAEASSIR